MMNKRQRLAHKAGLFFTILLLASCATYQGKVSGARSLIADGKFAEAVEQFKPLAEKKNNDQLVYMLDYGVSLQLAGQMKESNRMFIAADKLADQLDYHSVSNIAASMVLNEEMKVYKGDTFEKVFINAFLAMNFLSLNQLDDALVEARRMNEKYLKYRSDEKKKFELNVFGKYLSAIIWEANRSYDDAFIAYSEAYKIDSSIVTLPSDLVRSAKLAQRPDEYVRLKKQFPQVVEDKNWYDKSQGELVVLVQQGWGPRKETNPAAYEFPMLVPTSSSTQRAQVAIAGVGEFKSQPVYDVTEAAVETLKDDQAALLGRRLAAKAAKAVVADQVRQKDELLGALTWVAMRVTERADLRQWSTLPQTIQVIRVPLKAGKYKVSLQGLSFNNVTTADQLPEQEIEIKSGRKKFIVWRTLR